MNTNKVTYWMALGVLAVGLRSEYRNGKFPAIHRVAEHAESTVCQMVTRAERTIALARVLTSDQPSFANDAMASVRDQEMVQADLLREQAEAQAQILRDQALLQADLLRAHVERQRSQMERIRWRTESRFKFANAERRRVTLICPKTGATISVDAGVPDVEVGADF